jgi:hypothetical protein
VRRELEVARCIIETGCREISEAERILEGVERSLLEIVEDEEAEDVSSALGLLMKTRRGLPEAREILRVPRIKSIVQSYEFLSYFVYYGS